MRKSIVLLVIIIALLSSFAASFGIYSGEGPGKREFTSVHGEAVILHGEGIYKNMSADVAPQGIAQDYVTLFAAVPLLIIALFLSMRGNLRWRILLAGVLGYFFVTYFFYLMMGMFNELFLVYTVLLACSFFSLSLVLLSFDLHKISFHFDKLNLEKPAGAFLIFNSIAIALMWLGIVVPALINGVPPPEVQHYTTLVVQGLDLGLLLPLAFVAGLLLIKRRPAGYLIAIPYYIFLALLMTALTAKIIAMWMLGSNVIPAIFIIPLFNIMAIMFSVLLLKNIKISF